MQDADRLLSDAAALIQAEQDADVRAEAREVYLAEAARCRLGDRHGRGQVLLRSGTRLEGQWHPQDPVAGFVQVLDDDGRQHLVAERAIVVVTGTQSTLRVEPPARERTLGQWLREAWEDGHPVRALDASGTWHCGPISFVGADHAVVDADSGCVVLPYATVQVWSR